MAAAVPGESAPSGSESGDLFDPLPTAEGERYYAALRTRLPPAYQGFAVQFDEATGQKRMLASRPVPKGDTVLFDVPLVSMQTYKNKCHRFIGCLQSQVRTLATVQPPPGVPGLEPMCLLPEADAVPSLPGVDPLSPYCPGQVGCWFCHTQYCGDACRRKAWQQYHRQLCPVAYIMPEEAVAPVILGMVPPPGQDAEEDQEEGGPGASQAPAAGAGGSVPPPPLPPSSSASAAAAVSEPGASAPGVGQESAPAGAAVDELVSINAVELLHSICQRENEVFFMAAKVYAHILSTWRSNGGDMSSAVLPYRALHRAPWWDVVLAGTPAEEKADSTWSEEAMVLAMQQTCTDVLAVMKAVFVEQAPADLPAPPPAELARLFSLPFLGDIMGAFELNVMAVKIMNPIHSYVGLLEGELPPLEGQTADMLSTAAAAFWPAREAIGEAKAQRREMRRMAHEEELAEEEEEGSESGEESEEEEEESDDDSDEEEEFPFMSGMALMPVASTMDHSCEPNVEVEYPFFTRRVAVTATRDIGEGEPLLMSYVENEDSFQGRRAALAHYGFDCACPKCAAEGGAGTAAAAATG